MTTATNPNWGELSFSENGKRLTCESCGLPMKAGLRVPGRRPCCSVVCLECLLFGFGNCRWCGTQLEGKRRDARHCSTECHSKDVDARRNGPAFGNGERLLAYLAARLPEVYAKVMSNGQGCADAGAIRPA